MFKKWLLSILCFIFISGLFGCGNNLTTASTPAESQSRWTLFASGSQTNMLITKGDEIWAATTSGVERWNRKTGSCKLYTVQDGLPDSFFGGITLDNAGVIWAVSNFNAYSFDGTRWAVSYPENAVISGLIDKHPGNQWVSDATALVYFYSRYPQLFSGGDSLPANISFGSMLEDKKGNIWANLSGQGLAYYNGQSWQTFTAADGMAITSLSSIFVDNRNNLWCATVNGVSRYDGTRWQNFSSAETGFDGYATHISQDRQGNLWFVLNDSVRHIVYRYNGNTWDKFSSDGLTNPRQISVDNDGIIWCTNADGVSRYDGKAWRTFSATDGFTGIMTSILVDRNGDLWFGTDSAIKHFDGKAWQSFSTPAGPNDDQVNTMFMDKDGNLWFGTNGGITYHQGDTWKTFTQPDGLNSINSPIFQDAQGNIWWATNTGISRFDGKTVRKFDASDGIDMDYFFSVSSIVQDNQGNIWFGTQYSKPIATFPPGTTPDPNINKQPEGGIYRYNGKSWQKFTTKDGLSSTDVQKIIKDRQGNIWFEHNQSLSRYDGENWKIFTRADGITGTYIESLFVDKAGNIWAGTDSGLNRYDGKSWQVIEFPTPSSITANLYEAGSTLLFFGGNQIYAFTGQSWQLFAAADGVTTINTLAQGRDGELWAGTREGLAQYKDKMWQIFTVKDGLQFNNIQWILIDRDGNVWCSTAYGLARYQPNHM